MMAVTRLEPPTFRSEVKPANHQTTTPEDLSKNEL